MSDAALLANLRESAERDAQRQRLRSKPQEAFTLLLEGLEVPVASARVGRSIDTVADGWSAELAWTPGADRRLDELLVPFAYPRAQVYLGSTLVNSGRLYTVSGDVGLANLEGWSYTADLVDSHIPPDSWKGQWSSLSVWNLANELCRPLAIGVRTDIGNVTLPGQSARVTEPFEEIKQSLTETYAELLTRLASQRGLLVSCDEQGNLLLTAARVRGQPVATLEEGKPPVQRWGAKFDGRKRYARYTVYGQSGLGDDIRAQATDSRVPASRIANFQSPEVTRGNAQTAANWRRSKQLAEALTLTLPVTGWYTQRGELWAPNTLVSVVAPSLHIARGFTFLVRQVEYAHASSGQTANLMLMPPQVYSGEPIQEPWA